MNVQNFWRITQVTFEVGEYLIFGPKIDRWVDFTQCDYEELKINCFGEFVVIYDNDKSRFWVISRWLDSIIVDDG